jgi:hypothetical protein
MWWLHRFNKNDYENYIEWDTYVVIRNIFISSKYDTFAIQHVTDLNPPRYNKKLHEMIKP